MQKIRKIVSIKRIAGVIFFAFVIFFILRDYSGASDEQTLDFSIKQSKQTSEVKKRKANDYADGEVLVRYKKSAVNLKKPSGELKADNFEKGKNFTKLAEFSDLNIRLLQTSDSIEKTIKKLNADPSVELAEPNFKRYPTATPNDVYFSNYLWALNNTGQTVDGITGTIGADISAVSGWNNESSLSGTVIVADIDTGTNYSHPDLVGNMWDGTFCKNENNVSISGGCPNHGWNYDAGNNDPSDTDGHGSMTSGIIGASTNNSIGVSGTSYYNHTKIMSVKFGFDVASEINAINFAKNNGAKVINASYGGVDYSQLEKDAIDSFPGVFVAAAGNYGTDNDATHFYPSDYTSLNIISVTSTGQNDHLSTFSDYGPISVDLAAPGENIVSTNNLSTYSMGDGTSFSAPYVSGVSALLYEKNPNLSIEQMRYILLNSGDPLKTSTEMQEINSGKRLNLESALNMANNPPTILASTPVYRFWSSTMHHHFYTASEAEKNYVIANYSTDVWNYEGIAYRAFSQAETGIAPVYRFWSSTMHGHFYTASEAEKNYVIANYSTDVWNYEGIAFYVYTNQMADTQPVYRFWSSTMHGHFYTASEAEKNYVIANYSTDVWNYEGIAWYAPLN
jgi:hypothetical protein